MGESTWETGVAKKKTWNEKLKDSKGLPKVERITGKEVPVAWFAHGLRIVDISRPHAPREVAYYVPDVPPASERIQSNDVFVDDRGLIFLLDRLCGLSILERI